MKALTLTQPYGTLAAIEAKRIETRGWATTYRGLLAIHTASTFKGVGGKQAYQQLVQREPFASVLATAQLDPLALPLGAVIAVCELIDVSQTHLLSWGSHRYAADRNGALYTFLLTRQERAFGDYTAGRFTWFLANMRPLREPIPVRGALGLWEWTPPANLEALYA